MDLISLVSHLVSHLVQTDEVRDKVRDKVSPVIPWDGSVKVIFEQLLKAQTEQIEAFSRDAELGVLAIYG